MATSSEGGCIRCGLVAPSPEGLCPRCGDSLLSLERRTDREILEQALTRRDVTVGVVASLLFVGLLPLLLYGACAVGGVPLAFLTHGGTSFAVMLVLLLSAGLAFGVARAVESSPRRALRRALRERSDAPRLGVRTLTGAPIALAVLVLGLHLARELGGAPAAQLDALGLHPDQLRQGHGWPGLLTHALAHGSWPHVVANAVGLVVFGVRVDLRATRLGALVVVLAGVVCGGATHAWLTARPGEVLVGISGGDYALVGAMLTLMPTARAVLAIQLVRIPMPAWVWALAFVSIYAFVDALTSPRVAVAGHAGGFVGGALVGLLLRRVPVPEASRVYEARLAERLSAER